MTVFYVTQKELLFKPKSNAMNHSSNSSKTVSLRAVTQELLFCYGQANKGQQHYFINDVPDDMFIPRNSNWLAPLMGDLMEIISRRQDNSSVHITASYYRDKVQLHAR